MTMLLQPAQRDGGRYLNPVPTKVGGLSTIFKVGPRFFLGAKARSPREPLGPFHTDAVIYDTKPRSGLRITWMGHATSIVEIDGVRMLIDPVWDERASPTSWSGPKRFFPAPLELSDLPVIDAVIVSHDHYDHLGAGTIRALAQLAAVEGAQWIMPLGVSTLLNQLGIPAARCRELNWMDSAQVGAVQVTALPARHFSGRSLFNRFETLWASFALAARSIVCTRSRFRGVARLPRDRPAVRAVRLAMLEIGASDPLWAEIHMGPEGALRSFRALGGHGLLMRFTGDCSTWLCTRGDSLSRRSGRSRD